MADPMSLRAGGSLRVFFWSARLLGLVLLLVCPRALTAPARSFDRAQESKRPKPLKNIDRVTGLRVPNAERQGKEPRPPHPDLATPGGSSFTRVLPPRLGVPEKAFVELTKPNYLAHSEGVPPPRQFSPPA